MATIEAFGVALTLGLPIGNALPLSVLTRLVSVHLLLTVDCYWAGLSFGGGKIEPRLRPPEEKEE
jgi:hypothetical protein